jgi:hypothetical protein
VLNAYAELIANTPPGDAVQTSDEIEKFYESCQTMVKPDLYIDFMTHYCKHEKPQYEEWADVYTGRVM